MIPAREMAQDIELDEVRATTGLRSPAVRYVEEHRPGLVGLLLVALAAGLTGLLLGWSIATAVPRPAAQATARVDLFPGLSPARLTGAPLDPEVAQSAERPVLGSPLGQAAGSNPVLGANGGAPPPGRLGTGAANRRPMSAKLAVPAGPSFLAELPA